MAGPSRAASVPVTDFPNGPVCPLHDHRCSVLVASRHIELGFSGVLARNVVVGPNEQGAGSARWPSLGQSGLSDLVRALRNSGLVSVRAGMLR